MVAAAVIALALVMCRPVLFRRFHFESDPGDPAVEARLRADADSQGHRGLIVDALPSLPAPPPS
jgi:hypothetical protein